MIKKTDNKKITDNIKYGDRGNNRLKDVKMIQNNDIVCEWKLRQNESSDTIF